MNEGVLIWNTLPESGNSGRLKQALYRNCQSTMRLWNEMLRGYFVAKQPVKAISLLEGMLDLPAELEFGLKDVPLPSILTYNKFIKGFISIGDLDSAVKWFEKC
jgi:pentatricopeptide repeat protein